MLVKARITCFFVLMSFLAVIDVNALTYLDPKDRSISFKGILNDSIPLTTGERVVIERKGVVSQWVVALVNLSYVDMKKQIEDSIRRDYGIEEARELVVPLEGSGGIDLNNPHDPLFGQGFLGFRQSGLEMVRGREYQVVSKEYNKLADIDGYSVSKWRIGDGAEIFGRPCSLIVVQRADYSREWARDHTGIPWPFKTSGTNTLVTETEITRIDQIVNSQAGATVRYFVPYPAYKTGALLDLMKSIFEESMLSCLAVSPAPVQR